jgi:DNA primase
MTLGSPIGGAVKLGKPKGGIISICEGLETGLSVQQMFDVPVWVSLGSTFMHKIKLPGKDVVHTVRIYADGDDAGTSAIEKFKEQYSKDYKIEDYQAPKGKDYNDMLTKLSVSYISKLMDYIKKRFK